VVLKETEDSIYTKEYTISVLPNFKHTVKFDITYDSAYYAYPQKQIIYQGKIIKAIADKNEKTVIIRIKQEQLKNGNIITIITNKEVTEYFSRTQIESDLQPNIGKTLIITKVYYPRERIFYKTL
jgi:arabinogalactan endo-1,4-beta-galactosidase